MGGIAIGVPKCERPPRVACSTVPIPRETGKGPDQNCKCLVGCRYGSVAYKVISQLHSKIYLILTRIIRLNAIGEQVPRA